MLGKINDFLRRKDHKAALAEVKVTCAVLEEHAYRPIITLLYRDAFRRFVDDCKSKKPRLHGDFVDRVDAAKTDVVLFELHFVTNAKSEEYRAFLVHCKEKLCSENLLWLTCFLEMKKQVQNPERFLVLFYEGYKEYISVGANSCINLSSDHRKEIDEQHMKCFGYLPDRQRGRRGALDDHGPPVRARAAAIAVPPSGDEEQEESGEEEEQDKRVKKSKKTKKKGEELEMEEEDGGEKEQDKGVKKSKKTNKKGDEVEAEEDGVKKKNKDKIREMVAGCDDETEELEEEEGAKKKKKTKKKEVAAVSDVEEAELAEEEEGVKKTKKKEEEGGKKKTKKKVAGCDDEEVEEEERVKKTKKKVAGCDDEEVEEEERVKKTKKKAAAAELAK